MILKGWSVMKRVSNAPCCAQRSGMTWIEVTLVILCLIVLLAMLAPAIVDTRTRPRGLECINNLKNLGIAAQSYAVAHSGTLPALTTFAGGDEFGWPVALLPNLDENAVARDLEANGRRSSLVSKPIQVLTCPQDPNNHRIPQGLSYAANAGYGRFRYDKKSQSIVEIGTHSAAIDLDGDGEVSADELAINRATGVLWRDAPGVARFTLEEIEHGDGQSATLLFAENLQSRNWGSTNTNDIAFVIGRDALRFETGAASRGPLHLKSASLGGFALSANRKALPGTAPRPSSNHGDIVHVGFCDGRVSGFNVKIDPLVYARLMTPNGERYGQAPVDPADY
jgi:type II secretory pathway pseudopilin PulG